MKLNEILKIVTQPVPGIDWSKINNLKQIKDRYLDDYSISIGTNKDHFYFIVKLEDKIIAALIAIEIEDLKRDKQVLMIKRTWVEREFRNKGIISNLYRFLYNVLGYALISDYEQSPETIKLWDKLRSSWDVKMIDLETKEITDINSTELYGNKTKALIVETNNLFSSDILNDYIFCLNED